ncbi:MBL fold metallo-hydrolase [Dactylosporangium sp. NBC_01737]|uniref:MBL fold metallo-hydrolase n=1 Tax=Dactylosporangium sp. NBC_01737 TaxID=2975959 RepID=UPI002E10A71F|nr:MBL fold metallo-hydrolase [Dactylosporangium sp. NBC_01737]
MIHTVITEVHLPAGVAGPDPMDFDVRCFLIPHATGLTLVDTGLEHTVPSIAAQLSSIGAAWSDVTDVILTHDHPDHIGGLSSVTALAPSAAVWGGAVAAEDGTMIRGLRVVATPGHTPGHLSLLATDDDVLLIGDLAGTQDGRLMRAPAAFTADPAEAERSLRKASGLDFAVLYPSHGAPSTPQALQDLLDRR